MSTVVIETSENTIEIKDVGVQGIPGSGSSGTCTPTLTNALNISSSTAHTCQWLRVGNTVTVSGKVEIDPISNGSVELGLSLPTPSDFTDNSQCAGSFHGEDGDHGWIKADTVNNRASFNGYHIGTANQVHWFSFTYLVL